LLDYLSYQDKVLPSQPAEKIYQKCIIYFVDLKNVVYVWANGHIKGGKSLNFHVLFKQRE